MMFGGFGYGPNPGYGEFGATWFAILGLVLMILFWGSVIALGVWAVRRLAAPHHRRDDALDILRRRLAAGEISAEEYDAMFRTLTS